MSLGSLSCPDDEVVSIASSNETVDNIPGPGRNLGNVYLYFGRKLETLLNAMAKSRGAGPVNVRRRIVDLTPYIYYRKPGQEERVRARVKRELKRLIAYTKYKIPSKFDSPLSIF